MLLERFLLDPDQFTEGAVRTRLIEHQDGATERWQIRLDQNFSVFVDCSIPMPWSSTQQNDFYNVVMLVGFDCGGDNFYLP